jgi:hypothetical protein
MESGSCVDRNPPPSEDYYINILPDFLCSVVSVVTYRSLNKELSLLVRILLRVAAVVIPTKNTSWRRWILPTSLCLRTSLSSLCNVI